MSAVHGLPEPDGYIVGDCAFRTEAEAVEEIQQWGPSDAMARPYYTKDTLDTAIEAALRQSGEGVAGTTLRFGLGAFIVNTGTAFGQPAVFIDDAREAGQVGARAPNVPADTTPLLRLLFPTVEQAKAVVDALVNTAPPATSGLAEAARALLELIEGMDEADLLALDSDPHPPSSLSVAAADVRAALAAHDKESRHG